MNTAQAVALRTDRPRNRATRRPGTALYLVPSPVVPAPPADEPAPARQVTAPPAISGPATPRPGAARADAAGPRATGPAPASSWRLTRRGRVVVAAAAALLVTALSVIAAAAAHAANYPAPRPSLVQVVVRPGQTLWTVAQSTDPNADPRLIIQRIIDLNGLTGDLVQPGQRLLVPRS